MNDEELNTLFVFQSVEVKLTGRVATKNGEQRNRRSGKTQQIKDELVEITPADNKDGSWKKWVKKEELFTINTN